MPSHHLITWKLCFETNKIKIHQHQKKYSKGYLEVEGWKTLVGLNAIKQMHSFLKIQSTSNLIGTNNTNINYIETPKNT